MRGYVQPFDFKLVILKSAHQPIKDRPVSIADMHEDFEGSRARPQHKECCGHAVAGESELPTRMTATGWEAELLLSGVTNGKVDIRPMATTGPGTDRPVPNAPTR
jgi:hypothetical protein